MRLRSPGRIGALAALAVALTVPAAIQGGTIAAAQTEPAPEAVGPEFDAFKDALDRFTAGSTLAQPERRLEQLRSVQATFQRLAEEYPDSLAWAVLGRSLHSGLHPAEEMERQVAQILATVDQAVALLEQNREIRDTHCRDTAEACALIADAQATTDDLRSGEDEQKRANEARFPALSAIASAQAAIGLVEDARLTVQDAMIAGAEVREPELVTAFASALAAVGEEEAARAGFALAKEQIDRSYAFMIVPALQTIATAQIAAGMADEGRRTFEEALAVGDQFRPSVVRAQIAAGLFPEALAVVRAIPQPPGRAIGLSDISTGQAGAGRTEDGRLTLTEAQAAVGAVADEQARGLPLSRLANAQLALGLVEDARETLAEARAAAGQTNDVAARLTTLNDIASVQTAGGMVDDARRTLADALVEAGSLAEAKDRATFLARIAALQAAAGFREDARGTFSDALAAAAQGDHLDREFGVLFIVQAQADAGLFDDALASAAATPESRLGSQARPLVVIAAAQAAAGRFSDARATATRILDMDGESDKGAAHYIEALTEIAKAQAAAAVAAAPRQ